MMKNKKRLFVLLALMLLSSMLFAQKGKHFEFNYFAIELGLSNSFSGKPDDCMNRYYQAAEGKMHIMPLAGVYYTPGFSVGLQFHHDFQNDHAGFILGAVYNSWGNTAKYQSATKKITLTECNRVSSVTFPVFIKLGQEIYNQQCYFYIGTQPGINFNLITSQKVNVETGTKRSDMYKDALNKLQVPIVMGFNFTIINMKFGFQPKGFLNEDYDLFVDEKNSIKPFSGMSKTTFFANFAFVIPLSQWTVKRSYLLSRIF